MTCVYDVNFGKLPQIDSSSSAVVHWLQLLQNFIQQSLNSGSPQI